MDGGYCYAINSQSILFTTRWWIGWVERSLRLQSAFRAAKLLIQPFNIVARRGTGATLRRVVRMAARRALYASRFRDSCIQKERSTCELIDQDE